MATIKIILISLVLASLALDYSFAARAGGDLGGGGTLRVPINAELTDAQVAELQGIQDPQQAYRRWLQIIQQKNLQTLQQTFQQTVYSSPEDFEL